MSINITAADEAAINLLPAALSKVRACGKISLTSLHRELNDCGYGVAARCLAMLSGLGLVHLHGTICKTAECRGGVTLSTGGDGWNMPEVIGAAGGAE